MNQTQKQTASVVASLEDFLCAVDIFSLMHMRESTEAEKESVLKTIQASILESFVHNDLHTLLAEDDQNALDTVIDKNDQGQLETFLLDKIPDFQERLFVNSLEVKYQLFTDMLSSLWQTALLKREQLLKKTTGVIAEITSQVEHEITILDQMITCIEKEQWNDLTQLLEPFNKLDFTTTAKAVLAV